MLAKLHTFSLLGIEAIPVDVEVDVSPATLPKTILVGLPEAAVKESTHRVERAMVNSGFQRPYDRVVINLAPAELPKQAASFDLPITLGVLAGSGQLSSERFELYAVVGELSLEGRTRPAKGALSMAISAARQRGLRGIVVPDTNAAEAAVVEELEVIPVSSLAEAVAFFAGHIDIDPVPSRLQELFNTLSHYDDDYADVRGQELAKRALRDRGGRCTQPADARPAGLGQKRVHATTPYPRSCRRHAWMPTVLAQLHKSSRLSFEFDLERIPFLIAYDPVSIFRDERVSCGMGIDQRMRNRPVRRHSLHGEVKLALEDCHTLTACLAAPDAEPGDRHFLLDGIPADYCLQKLLKRGTRRDRHVHELFVEDPFAVEYNSTPVNFLAFPAAD